MTAALRIGIVGAGFIAERHVRMLDAMPDASVVAISDPMVERAQALATPVQAHAYDDWRAMLERERLEAVFVCTPPFVHGALEMELIERGIPFLVEKPLAADPETAERIGEAVGRAGLVTAVGYHWRWLDTVEEVKRLLEDRPARLVSGYWLDFTPPPAWWSQQASSGGQFVEQTTHIFDLARHLVGEVRSVCAVGAQVPRESHPHCDVDAVSAATLTFGNGAVGSMLSTCLLHQPHRVGLHLFSDGLAIELHEHEVLIVDGRERRTLRPVDNPFALEDRAFLDAVRGRGNRIRSDYADALVTHRLTAAAVRSRREGRPVSLASEGLAERTHA